MNLISFSKLFSLFFTFKCGFLNIFISLLELEKSNDNSIDEIISMQKTEANAQFFRFISNNYENCGDGQCMLSNFHGFKSNQIGSH